MPARPRTRKRTHVFLNCPFDDDYEAQFLALIAGLTGLGLTPRCVLEIPADKNRLQRLFHLIRQCASSVHDLSRVQLSPRPPRVPRFNMPFELGLAVALSLSQPRHRWYLLEAKRHRLQANLSDVNVPHESPRSVRRFLTDSPPCRSRSQPSSTAPARQPA